MTKRYVIIVEATEMPNDDLHEILCKAVHEGVVAEDITDIQVVGPFNVTDKDGNEV